MKDVRIERNVYKVSESFSAVLRKTAENSFQIKWCGPKIEHIGSLERVQYRDM